MNTTTTTAANTKETPNLYRFASPIAAMRHAINPAYFAESVLSFQPDETQRQVLELNPHRLILNCNRQWGKSTVSAILLAHRAIFSPGSLSIIVSSSERQSAETLRKVAGFIQTAGVHAGSDKVNRRSLLIPGTGSRIIALPSSDATVRGFSKVSLLMIDEASRVPDPLYYALRPSLAVSQGDIVMVSTPFGKRGFFYSEFANSSSANEQKPRHQQWTRITVPASQCPRIPADFLDDERALGEEYFAQEYECQFIEDGRFLFTDADCRRLFKSDIEPLRIHDRRGPAWQNVMKPVSANPETWPNIYSREE
jgi:hypothetical protein